MDNHWVFFTGVLAEYMNSQIQLEHKLQEREEEVENLRSQLEQTVNDLHKLKLEEHKLLEEKNLFLTQKEALVEGRSETELSNYLISFVKIWARITG